MKEVWNHNYAYNNWIKKNCENKKKILDVGCGDGRLIFKLVNDQNELTGIDLNKDSITTANNNNKYSNIKFHEGDFLKYNFKEKYDAIIFVASIHHLNMREALIKAKELLNKNGLIIIVGLSKPSTIFDWLLEIIRFIPSNIISKIKHNTDSEELNLTVNYDIPQISYIKKILKKELPNYKIKYGLHYRYLLTWKNRGE